MVKKCLSVHTLYVSSFSSNSAVTEIELKINVHANETVCRAASSAPPRTMNLMPSLRAGLESTRNHSDDPIESSRSVVSVVFVVRVCDTVALLVEL